MAFDDFALQSCRSSSVMFFGFFDVWLGNLAGILPDFFRDPQNKSENYLEHFS